MSGSQESVDEREPLSKEQEKDNTIKERTSIVDNPFRRRKKKTVQTNILCKRKSEVVFEKEDIYQKGFNADKDFLESKGHFLKS